MNSSKRLIILTVVLILTGVVILFSASSFVGYQNKNFQNNPYFFVSRQIMHIFIGLFLMLVFRNIKMDFIKKLSPAILFTSLVLLILVLFIGKEINGARRWLDIYIINFQPSDLAETAIIVFLSAFLSTFKSLGRSHTQMILILIIIFIMIFFIAIEPNLSTAMVLSLFVIALLFISKVPLIYAVSLTGISIVSFIAMIFKFSHAMARIKMSYLSSGNSQITNSVLAVANGGLLGEGIGMGKFKLLFIPEVFSDYIFTTVAEEFGFVGSIILIGLYIWLLAEGIHIAKKSLDPFSKTLAFGITYMIFVKALIHIAISLRMLPSTGVSLPFISYGGTSIVFDLCMMGMLMSIARNCEYEN